MIGIDGCGVKEMVRSSGSFFKEGVTGLITFFRIRPCFVKRFLMTVSKSVTLELLLQCLIQYPSLPKSISRSLLTHCNLSKSFYSLRQIGHNVGSEFQGVKPTHRGSARG